MLITYCLFPAYSVTKCKQGEDAESVKVLIVICNFVICNKSNLYFLPLQSPRLCRPISPSFSCREICFACRSR